MASDIQEIKSRLDIADVIGSYISLKKAGSSYKACCPFHGEKTPSLIVTPSLGIFKCFGCGESGDVISFIQKYERVEFPEALQIAADKAGYKLTKQTVAGKQETTEYKQILQANELATKYWHHVLVNLPLGQAARDYMAKRGIPVNQMEKFKIGYAPKGSNLTQFLISKGFKNAQLVDWGLSVERNGKITDKFRQRVIFPIWNTKGEIIAFSGRIIMPSEYAPKYLNSPETLVYKKGNILMGYWQAKDAARKADFVILEEGNMDLLSSHKVGVENIVATGGTALTTDQLKLLSRIASTVYFAFDTDAAGTKALINGVAMCEELGIQHKALDIGNFTDPDELIKSDPENWAKVVATPQNSVSLLLNRFANKLDLRNPDSKSELVKKFVPILKSLQDPVQQTHFTAELANLVGVDVAQINKQLNIKASTSAPAVSATSTKGKDNELYLIALLLQGNLFNQVDISKQVFSNPVNEELFIKASKQPDFALLLEELTDTARENLQQALAWEINVPEFKEEALKVYKFLYAKFLKLQIIEIKQNMQTDDSSSDTLAKLNYLLQELKAN